MQNGIDLKQFYQELDALYKKKNSAGTISYLENCLREA